MHFRTSPVDVQYLLAAMSSWRNNGAEFHEKIISPTRKSRTGLIMHQVCVAARGMGNISLVEGRMNSVKYQQNLKANIILRVKGGGGAEDEKMVAATTR